MRKKIDHPSKQKGQDIESLLTVKLVKGNDKQKKGR